jgi:SAM-dependent methyltransferase
MTSEQFYKKLFAAFTNHTFVKATLGNTRQKNSTLKNVLLKPVTIKEELKISVVYRHATNDITKNFSALQCIDILQQLLADDFYNMDVFTAKESYHIIINKKNTIKIVEKISIEQTAVIDTSHNKVKERLIGNLHSKYLNDLGITTANGEVKKEKQYKYKQINRYVEIMADVLRQADLQQPLHIADMGSGKGYLTFALAEYLATTIPNATITGVEMRTDMVDLCNNIAQQNKFAQLQFVQGTIQQTTVANMNVLIALHACDTATDDAIKKGIAADANIIVCAPCCHKQIRNAMQPNAVWQTVTKHGILLERQAEIATDALRALWLESKGYKTKVFDFVDVNDTPKNVMIVAVKTNRTDTEKNNFAQQFTALKNMFGIAWCAIEQ